MRTLRRRQTWGLGVVVACIVLLGLVAIAADGSPLHAPEDRGDFAVPDRVVAALEIVFLVGGSAILVLLLVVLAGDRRSRDRAAGRRSLLRTILMFAAMAALASALLPLRRDDRPANQPTNDAAAAVPTTVPTSRDGSGPIWPVGLLVVGIVGALGAAAWLARRRHPFEFDDDVDVDVHEARVQATSLFDASLADLDAEPDPRRAIIAAYARLLDGLQACGLGRRPAEAPEEHLRRALATLRVPEAPLRTLVALFAEARFSQHVLTASHKAAALDAFRAARDDLAAAVRT